MTHRDSWSAPKKGWPTFDENGKLVEEPDERTLGERYRDIVTAKRDLSDEDQDKIAELLDRQESDAEDERPGWENLSRWGGW